MPQQAYTIKEFVREFRISKAHLYKLLQDGNGPCITKLGKRTLITAECAQAWIAANTRPMAQGGGHG